MIVAALTVAGSDSGGAAGMQADLKTFLRHGVHGCAAVTAVTVQNSLGVTAIHEVPPEIVAGQVAAVCDDLPVRAVKTGMLASAPIIRAVAAAFRQHGIGRDGTIPLVIDPVAASGRGNPLLRADALEALRTELFPLATLVTPNLDEVRLLVDVDVRSAEDAQRAAEALYGLGPAWVLVKGGHARWEDASRDLLYDGSTSATYEAARIPTPHVHGGGDTLAASICSWLARGASVPEAVAHGKAYVTKAVEHSYPLGAGVGPVGHFWPMDADVPATQDGGEDASA